MKAFYTVDAGASFLELAEAPVSIRTGETVAEGKGRAQLRFQPRFILSIATYFVDRAIEAYLPLSRREGVELSFGTGFKVVKAVVRQLKLDVNESAAAVYADLIPNPQRMTYGDSNQRVARLLVHVVNFPLFISSGEGSDDVRCAMPNGGWKYIGRVVINDPPWRIELQELPESKAVVERLEETASYGITHVAELSRQDGKEFCLDDANLVIQHLYLFLSFARGAWSPPILGVGFDEAGGVVYHDWSTQIGTPWEMRRGWFDVHHGRELGCLFSGFRTVLVKPVIGKALSSALYWYLRSNRGGEGAGMDSGVILTQAALERLAVAYLESEGVKMRKRAAASDYLRETLSRMRIPVSIPDGLTGLTEGQRQCCWMDGPEALARVRNELVHPRNRLPIKIGGVIADSWNLGQWYTELIILHLSGHTGEYANRLTGRWVGEVETVPWADTVSANKKTVEP